MAGERAFSRRARSVSAAKRVLPAASPTPAHTAAMSLRWFQVRSSSSRIVRARASSGVGREAERLLAGVRVGDAVRDRSRRRRRARRTPCPPSSVAPSAARSSPRCL